MFQSKGNEKLYTAIVFFSGKDIQPHKYRNVKFPEFLKYAERLDAWYVNFYHKDKTYSHRAYVPPYDRQHGQ